MVLCREQSEYESDERCKRNVQKSSLELLILIQLEATNLQRTAASSLGKFSFISKLSNDY